MSSVELLPYPSGGSEMTLAEFPGVPDGMARYAPQQSISDTEAWTLFDVLLDRPGVTRRRGPVVESGATTVISSARSIGLLRAQDPAGTEVVLRFIRSGGVAGQMRGAINSSMTYAWPYIPEFNPFEIFDAKDALGGGVVIGTATKHGMVPTNQAVALWRGAAKDTTAASAATVARGDLTIAVAAGTGANFSPGHFVFGTSGTPDQLIGVVKSISTDTLTLEKPALAAEATSVYGTPFRGINPRVSTGRITTSTSSSTVNGGKTKFKAQGMASGTWDFFTPDFTYIGTVSSVTSDTSITLTASAAVALLNADYIAINRTGSYELTRNAVGYLNAQYGGFQFYADKNILRFSDDDDPETVDLTANGNSIVFSADPIRALIPGEQGLVVITEKEAYVLLGGIGTLPSQWRGERIHDDGIISAGGGIVYQGGVIFPGKRGIWYWNGGDPVNIVTRLGDDYRRFVEETNRCWSMIVKDHLFVHFPSGNDDDDLFLRIKNQTTTEVTSLTFCVNLKTGAVSLMTNLFFTSWIEIPESLANGTVLYCITSDATESVIAKGDDLFNDAGGLDEYMCEHEDLSVAPDFYIETKKYDFGAGQRLKLIKMILLHYLSAGSDLKLNTVKGLGTTGELATSDWAASTTFVDRRIKFMKRSQHIAFRIYQESSAATKVVLGSWAIGFKWKRPGRV